MDEKYISQIVAHINTKRQTERGVLSKRNTIIYVGVSITKIGPMKSAVLRKFP